MILRYDPVVMNGPPVGAARAAIWPFARTDTDVERGVERRAQILPPYRVILHNDDVNSMDHVVIAIEKSVPGLTQQQAIQIMLEAHISGSATVITCPLELAELYRDRLESFGLTATIERA